MVDVISSENIHPLLKSELKNKIKIQALEKTTSTNALVRECATECDEGLVIIAGEQTAGRGRMGRAFFSPGNSGVYMSLLLKPQIKPQDAIHITTAAAVSVCRALESMGIANPKIKWVNDIFINNRKVCGILTESSFDAQKNMLNYAVLGVGVNIYQSEEGFPEEIQNIAGAVFEERKVNLRNEFIAAFLNEFFGFYNELSLKKYLTEYKEKSFVLGKAITVIQNEKTESARAIDIDENCNLVVEMSDGTVKKLYSGEISVRLS